MAKTKPVPNKNSKFWIHPDDFQKVIDYAAASYNEFKSEIAGQMIVVPDEEGDFILKFPVIMEQTVSSGLCTLDETALAQHYASTAMKHGADVRFCWWHSHHTMGVFWSGTDIKGIEEYSDGDMSFALVVNLKRENKFRLSMWKPAMMHLDTTLQIMGTKTSTVPKKIVDEVTALCEEPTPYVSPYEAGKKWDNRTQGNLFKTSKYKSFNRGYMDTSDYGEYAEGRMNHGIDTGIEVNEFLGREYNHCYGFLVDLIDSLVNEGMEYEKYIRTLNKFNERLKVLGGDWAILTIEKNDVKPELEFEDIDKYITVKGKTMEELYFAEFSY